MKRKESKRKIDKIWEIHHYNKEKLEQKKSSIRRDIKDQWFKTRINLYTDSEYQKLDSYIVDDYHQDDRDPRIKFHPGDD